MALFAKFKNAKNAAVEHKKTAAAQQAKPPAAPYKHVPTHAAQDALAAQPITLKPEELQARIAKARKRRASSYQSPVAARHSVYHSCESSRMSSRTNSTANSTAHFALASHPSSIKGQSSSGGSIDAVMRRSQSVPQQQGTSNSELRREDYLLPGFAGHSPFSSPGTQRPRPSQNMSSRSSFAKKKSPLSSVSSEDGTSQSLQRHPMLTQWQSPANYIQAALTHQHRPHVSCPEQRM